MPFPLLHLPCLSIREVMNSFGRDDIISLVLCSRKTYQIVKFTKPSKQGFKLGFSVGSRPMIDLDNGDDVHRCIYIKHTSELLDGNSLQVVPVNNLKVPMTKDERGEFELYWSDIQLGIKEVAVLVSGLFNCKFDEFSIVFETDPSSQIWAIDWMKSYQESVKELSFCTSKGVEPLANDLTYMFANLKITHWLYFEVHLPDNLQRPNFRIAPQTINSMDIITAYWMTLDHVLALECVISCIPLSNLTNLDMNVLLKHAVNGWNPRLKSFDIGLGEDLNFDVILEGLEVTDVPDDVVRVYTDSEGVYKIYGGYDIKRKTDGSTITVGKYGPKYRCFGLVVASVL